MRRSPPDQLAETGIDQPDTIGRHAVTDLLEPQRRQLARASTLSQDSPRLRAHASFCRAFAQLPPAHRVAWRRREKDHVPQH